MQIERNRTGTYSLFTPMHYERMGKYNFRVWCVGFISDGDFEEAHTGLIDERHRKQFTVNSGVREKGQKWVR